MHGTEAGFALLGPISSLKSRHLPYFGREDHKLIAFCVPPGLIQRQIPILPVFLYRLSEAGNKKYCYKLHARSGLRFIDRPEGRWLVSRLGTRGEARPAGWSLHRTGMRPDMRVGFLVFSYTEELTSEETLLHSRISAGSSSALCKPGELKTCCHWAAWRAARDTMLAIAQIMPPHVRPR